MSTTHQLALHPERTFVFLSWSVIRADWAFLGTDGRETIMRQIQYLRFHGWLAENLVTCTPEGSPEDGFNALHGPIYEGFRRTDIILYAAICEYALFLVLKKAWEEGKDEAPQSLREAFEKKEKRTHCISNKVFNETGSSGKLMLVEDVSVPIPDSLVKFQQLIRAGLDMGIYDGALFAELEKLNQHRNTVHLGKHWMRIKQIRIMDAEERQSACETVEKLRCALLAFVPPPPEPEMDIPF